DRPRVLRDADDLQRVLVARLELDQIRDLLTAGGTPGRPEVHEDDLAAERGGRDGTSVEIDAGERRDFGAVLQQPDAAARGRRLAEAGLDALRIADHHRD